MKKKNSKKEHLWPVFNTEITYTIPLTTLEKGRFCFEEEPISGVKITQLEKDGFIHAEKDGYQDKWFIAQYFEWLLYTGYIKKDN